MVLGRRCLWDHGTALLAELAGPANLAINHSATKKNLVKMATIDEIRLLLDEILKPMEEKLDVLVATSPHAAMMEKGVPVVQGRNPFVVATAIDNGATDTWTYVKYPTGAGVLFLAVSCAHCGLCYPPGKNDPDDDVFLSVPFELIEMGIRWAGLLPGYQCGERHHARTYDICIVCLARRVPDWVTDDKLPVLPEHPTDWRREHANLGCMIAGSSKTGEVHRRNLAPDEAEGGYTLVFVEDSGEQAGNSGTLMFQLKADGTTKVIGV